jgi:tetratricopeptide (TPR) repeat protein
MVATAILQANAPQNQVMAAWHIIDQKAAAARIKLAEGSNTNSSQFDLDYSNVQVSVNWLAGQDDLGSAKLLIDYLRTLFPYLLKRGHNLELDKWCIEGLRACKTAGQNPTEMLLIQGESRYALGRWAQAKDCFEQACTESGGKDDKMYARSMFALGQLQMNQGEFSIALDSLKQAEDLFTKLGETEGVIESRSEVAAYHLNQRDLQKALAIYLDIEELEKQGGGQPSEHTLLMLGVVYRQMNEYERALPYLSRLYETSLAQNSRSAAATAAHHLAWAYLELGRLPKARHLCGQAIAFYEDIMDRRGLSDAYEQQGAILLKEKKPEAALTYLGRSLDVRQQIGNKPGIVSSMRRIAFAQLLLGRYWQMLVLIVIILFRYLQLNMLSRQRVVSLTRDFFTGLSIAAGLNPEETTSANPKPNNSLMETFARLLVGKKENNK